MTFQVEQETKEKCLSKLKKVINEMFWRGVF